MDLLYQIDDPVHFSSADGLNRFFTKCMWEKWCNLQSLYMNGRCPNIVFVCRFFHATTLRIDTDGFHRFGDGVLDASVIVGGHHSNGAAANYAGQFEQHHRPADMPVQR